MSRRPARAAELALAALTAAAVLAPAGAAAASASVERSGWWSSASGGGLAVPQPAAEEGDLRIGRVVGTTSFAAVMFRSEEGLSAGLELLLRENVGAGEPDVVACPTADADWPGGDNQPASEAPLVDCALASAVGTLNGDGTALTFALDDRFLIGPGVWSIALLPDPDGGLPFTVDLQAPTGDALSVNAAFTFPSSDDATAPSGGDDGTAAEPPPPSFETVPDAPMTTSPVSPFEAPAAAALEAPALPDPDEPEVAEAPATTPPALAQRTAAAPEGALEGARLLALVMLVAVCVAVGHAMGQQRPGPRLLGGRARLAGAAGAGADAVGGAVALLDPRDRPRGIGRFAKPRDAAPRRLR